jgi:hypothetical protein
VSLLDAVFVFALVTGLIALLFLGTRWIIPKVIFGAAVLVGLLVAESSKSIAQFQVQQLLESASRGAPVSINGQQVQNGDEVLIVLKGLRDLPAHHSHPVKRITVEVSEHGHLLLWLGRDSDDPREYWVYYPRHLITRNNEIGRIITPLFDAY